MDHRSLKGNALESMEIIQHPDNLGMWETHIGSVLFWNRLNSLEAITESLKPRMFDGVAELYCYRTGSANLRQFIIRCKTCNTFAGMKYGPYETDDNKNKRIQEVLQFLRVSSPRDNAL